MADLKKCVRNFIADKGVDHCAKLFGVSHGTVSNWLNGKTPPSVDAVELVLAETGPAQEAVHDKLVEWEGRKVAILLPAYKTFNPDTHFTLFANYAKYGADKIAMPKPVKGTCVWEARNKLAALAKKMPEVKDCIMCDDDMIIPFGQPDAFRHYYGEIPYSAASMNAISRLVSHPEEVGIVGCLYFGRHEGGRAQCQIGFSSNEESQKLREGKYSGLIPMDWVGTGLIRIKKWVFEKMDEAIEAGKWPECKPSKEGLYNGYFAPLKVGVGEDLSFCLRAKEIGIQTYLDASLVCLHAGEVNYGPKNTKG